MLVQRWSHTAGNAVMESVHGHSWSIGDQLLALIVDLLGWLVWKTNNAKGRGQRPKPLERPWQKARTHTLGSEPIPAKDFHAWWEAKKTERQRRRHG